MSDGAVSKKHVEMASPVQQCEGTGRLEGDPVEGSALMDGIGALVKDLREHLRALSSLPQYEDAVFVPSIEHSNRGESGDWPPHQTPSSPPSLSWTSQPPEL